MPMYDLISNVYFHIYFIGRRKDLHYEETCSRQNLMMMRTVLRYFLHKDVYSAWILIKK